MESEDYMHDANELTSAEEEDDYYSGGGDDIDDGDYDFMPIDSDADEVFAIRAQKNYTVLKEEDIRKIQGEDIMRISNVLSISREAACILLRRYNWNVNDVHEQWFADEGRVRKSVGLFEKPVVQFLNAKKVTCGICFDNYSHELVHSAACGHAFCDSCWKAYVSTSINDGPGCLTLRCPSPSCGAAIGQDMIDMLASDEDKEKYRHYLLRSFVEDSRETKWCPAPGCDCAIEYDVGSGNYDVTCSCSYSFCWNCTEEAHRPVDCETVAKWILKNSAESENMNWILANSKPCPKCKRPIEKNEGEAETGLERLHQCAEKELQTYLNAEGRSKDFNDFCIKLAGLTSLSELFFHGPGSRLVLEPNVGYVSQYFPIHSKACT
ncbi:unnamed protein product [Fraxinus pennsylvanica]|uniref:RBR-type E3 ubiquitin transferase n=1 Tax=Fraxinus pennsylvanica TaxID=56036 RepID=A0AAD1Z544_9LAMI|nr:unnamed protein product [Fraxinus pennsylvanica]